MNHAITSALGLAAVCATSHAQINALFPGQLSQSSATAERVTLSNIAASGLTLDGLKTSGLAGHSSNPLFELTVDPNSRVVGLDWSLNVNASNPVKLSDLRIALYSVNESGNPVSGVLLTPGSGINSAGTMRLTDERLGKSGADGVVDLTSLGLDFNAGSNSTIYVEIFSTYPGDDITMKADSTFKVITANVPAPGSVALLGTLGLIATRRRRS